ncbi:hypothetical protein [Marispirochaeta sp.]|uniref:hypothetical protein n=1 Tax=Marispirochaeta sp. TaxID=2038653 RepID=UPI003749FCBB
MLLPSLPINLRIRLKKFKELVKSRSNDRIETLIHPSNAMGNEKQTFEMLSDGSVEYGVLGTLVESQIKLNKPSHEQLDNFSRKLTEHSPCG